MSARWSLLLADTDGTVRGEWLHARGLSVSFDLRGPATASWGSSGDDPAALIAHETASDVMLYRDGVLMFRGRLGTSGDELDADRHDVSWSAVDYRGLLERRSIVNGSGWPNADQTVMAWQLIDTIQGNRPWTSTFYPNGDMGITDASTPTGRVRDRSYEHGKSVGEAITQLSEVIDGFDWEITPTLQFKTWYPQRGGSKPWVADFGGTISRVRRTLDTGDYATDIMATGDGIKSRKSVTGPYGPGGQWDRAMAWSDVSIPATLSEHAEAALADASVIRPTYELGARKPGYNHNGDWQPAGWTPDDAWLGDTTRVVIQSGRLNVDTTGRILAIKIGVADDGDEDVTLTYGRRAVTLADRLVSMRDQTAALTRR